ncbi:small, acid-soluble spore protein L [Radiobacillus sp. PE A8.2]
MSQKRNTRSNQKLDTSVNPQGLTEDEANQRPQSQSEQRAKKTNTKR